MSFADLNLIAPILRAVAEEGYDVPTPIQTQSIPHVLAGRDLLGCAQTGTGKTAAFALPILQRLATQAAPRREGSKSRPIRALILTPTRELAAQIGESFSTYGRHLGLRCAVIFGGVGQNPQIDMLRRGVDILVATPGRLLDLASQRAVSLEQLEIFVLDEADRMLDMGFIHDVKRVIAMLPQRRQTLFFSATMPPEAQALADRLLTDPAKVEVTPVATTAERIEQRLFFVEKADKRALLEHVLQDRSIERVLVFTRTKHGANRVAEQLERARIGAAAIHGNKSQGARERALAGFKEGTTRVLVATDIAARGIDVDGVTHVINYDLPNIPESYVHRIGRTARAGASGVALSFCDGEERAYLVDIERLIRMRIEVVTDHPHRSSQPPPSPGRVEGRGRGDGGRPQQQQQQRSQRPGPRPAQAGAQQAGPRRAPSNGGPARHRDDQPRNPQPRNPQPRSPQPPARPREPSREAHTPVQYWSEPARPAVSSPREAPARSAQPQARRAGPPR